MAEASQWSAGTLPGRRVYRQMRQALRTRLHALLAYTPYVQQPECYAELHAMRIAAKRLRYTMQAFAPLYPDALAEPIDAARTLQTLLGDIHDCDVWAQDLPQFLEAERDRTLAYFGQVEPFASLVPGILALQHNRATVPSAALPGVCDVLAPGPGAGRLGALATDTASSSAASGSHAGQSDAARAEDATGASVHAPAETEKETTVDQC